MTTSASPWTRCGSADRGGEELRLVGALMRFWYVRGHLREGSSRCEDALAAHDDQSPASPEGTLRGRSPRPPARRLPAGGGAHAGATRARSPPRRRRSCRELADRHGSDRSRARRPRASSSGVHGGRGACARRRLHLVSRGRHRQPGRSRTGAGRLRAGEGSPRGKPRTLPSSSATRERSWKASSVSASSRLARAGATRPRHSCVRVSSTPRRWSTRNWRSGAWESWPRSPLSEGDAERAARLTGAIETLREETGHAATPEERRLGEQTRNALASELGEEHLAAALLIGREMTFEQAMVYALQK